MESEREGGDIVEVDALIVHPAVYFLFYLYYFTMPSRKRKKKKKKKENRRSFGSTITAKTVYREMVLTDRHLLPRVHGICV